VSYVSSFLLHSKTFLWHIFSKHLIWFKLVWILSWFLSDIGLWRSCKSDSIHESLNHVICESNHNALIHINCFLWSCVCLVWIISYGLHSYQPSSRLVWFDSNIAWIVSTFIALDLSIYTCLNRIILSLNRIISLFLPKILHLSLLPIYSYTHTPSNLLNQLQITF